MIYSIIYMIIIYLEYILFDANISNKNGINLIINVKAMTLSMYMSHVHSVSQMLNDISKRKFAYIHG